MNVDTAVTSSAIGAQLQSHLVSDHPQHHHKFCQISTSFASLHVTVTARPWTPATDSARNFSTADPF